MVDSNTDYDKISIDDVDIEILRSVSLQTFYEYMNYLNRSRGNRARTRARKVASIRSFYKYLYSKAGLIDENPAAEPIIIFGGSPIRVAVPPIFDAKISVINNGTGLISSSLAIAKVTGIIRITVVTLSKNADAIAVNKAKQQRIVFGCPLVFFNISFATQLNIPLLVAILTIIIIDTSKNITLKSTKLIK